MAELGVAVGGWEPLLEVAGVLGITATWGIEGGCWMVQPVRVANVMRMFLVVKLILVRMSSQPGDSGLLTFSPFAAQSLRSLKIQKVDEMNVGWNILA